MLATGCRCQPPTAFASPRPCPKAFDGKTGEGLFAREVVRVTGRCAFWRSANGAQRLQALELLGPSDKDHPLRRAGSAAPPGDDRRRPGHSR